MVYNVRKDVEDIFGVHNVKRWADIENSEDNSEIDARIVWAIEEAFDQLNGRLEQCRYTVPFNQVTVDPIINHLAATLTGVLLYDSRQLIDEESFDQLQFHRTGSKEKILQIHAGQLKLITETEIAKDYPQNIDVFAEDADTA